MDMDFIQIGLNTATLENKRRAYRSMLDASLVDHRVGAFVEYTYLLQRFYITFWTSFTNPLLKKNDIPKHKFALAYFCTMKRKEVHLSFIGRLSYLVIYLVYNT